MIASKKSYAEQLLQLALALSLLQVDPENVLGRGWDSQLEYRNGNGWELEMLRAVPMTEYPYANRKAMMPLIEDLVRFDRQINNFGDVTAFLLNVQGGQYNQSLSASDLENNTNSGAVALDPGASFNQTTAGAVQTEADLFLNSEHFEDQVSILDQNLSDLTDFGDLTLNNFNPYFGMPMKEEPQDNSFNLDIDIKLENDTASTSDFGPIGMPTGTNDTFGSVHWPFNATKEKTTNNTQFENEESIVKNEPLSDDEKSETDCSSESNNTPFLSNVEVTDEESEIVEVLWKQDVDLGYSLSPSKLAAGTSDINSTKSSPDDVEKLKALEELKLETPKDELDDEWAGIPFTIDNETGEYIRLPLQLDELLQDVLQLAELSNTDQEESSNPIASTSQSSSSNHQVTTTKSENLDDLDANDLDAQCDIEISSLFDLENATTTSELSEFSDLEEFDMMIQSASPYHHQHHRNGQNYGGTNSAFRQSTGYHQSRVPPLSRGVSMEQRLQDIANLFNPIPGMGVGMGVGEMSPYSHYPSPYPYQGAHGMPQHGQYTHPSQHPVLHNTSLADLGATQPHYGHNIGSAVTSSMHLTNSSHENDTGSNGYKMEHDNMMFYPNSTTELNHTTEGFINSILNDEDLHLMDMNVNEGFCSMRMLDANNTSNNSSVLGSVTRANTGHAASNIHMSVQNSGTGSVSNSVMGADGVVSTNGGDRLDASSDSAVSSMGSERVPSLSDVEWGEGSDSAQDYHQGKYGGPYDYSYNSRLNDGSRQPPVAQKKHQMFGKRYFHEPSPMQANLPPSVNPPNSASHMVTPIKYEYEPYGNVHSGPIGHNLEGAVGPIVNKDHAMSVTEAKYGGYSLDFSARPPRNPHEIINHNHTYSLPQGTGSNPRPQLRDKRNKKTAEEEHLTRDEKRARSLNVPITVSDIINLPMDEFNERLSKYDLTENQLSLIRDIRRRGKNKVAAQNCRKRKLDQILSLEDEVKEVRKRKEQLYHERDIIVTERRRITNKFATLHRHIFQYLRDSDGNLCSPNEYSLQQAADGSVYLLRKDTHKSDTNNTNGNSTVPTNNNIQNQHQHHHHHQQQPHQHSHPQQGPSSNHRHHHSHHHNQHKE